MKAIFDLVLIRALGLGSSEMIIILVVLLAVLIGIPVICYRLGWKSGYKAGKIDVLEKKDHA